MRRHTWLQNLVLFTWATLIMALFLFVQTARAQDAPQLVISRTASLTLTAGFDTATVERVFCVWWHDVVPDTATNGAVVALDSAYAPHVRHADSLNVTYDNCPRLLATAHWHFLDKGAWAARTPVDSESLVQYPHPFGVVILRRAFGDRIPRNWIYYDR